MIGDFTEKMQAYSSCDVFCLPTSYEGTSQAIFEAMTQKKPVVSTRTGGIPFKVEDGKEGYLVNFGVVGALADSLVQVLRDRQKSAEMGELSAKRVMDFQYPNLATGLHSIYQEILQSNGN